ncbi:MAG: hypothetical protein WC942_09835 [Clostridia bacterium]|jgi:hypothetical protein
MNKITKKEFKELLNKEYPFNKEDKGKGKNGKYKPSKRAYGDYLYSQDKEMFNVSYKRYLETGEL